MVSVKWSNNIKVTLQVKKVVGTEGIKLLKMDGVKSSILIIKISFSTNKNIAGFVTIFWCSMLKAVFFSIT